MQRTDLTKYLSVPVIIEEDRIVNNEKITIDKALVFTLKNMVSELLNYEISSPEIFYRKYINIDSEDTFKKLNKSVNLYVIPANQAGIEFTKTKASDCTGNRIYEVLSGGGTAVIQYFKDNTTQDIILLTLKKGAIFILPREYTVSFSNTKQTSLIITELRNLDSKDLYKLEDLRGMAYYIIRKNAKQEIVQNPVYKYLNKYRKVTSEKISLKYKLSNKTPLIKQLLRNNEKITALLNMDSITL